MAIIDLKQLLLAYGNRIIKVKATGTGFEDSDYSNTVTYASLPTLSKVDASTLRVGNLRAACSTYTLYNGSNTVLKTISFSGSDGDYEDVDVTNFGFTSNAYNDVYVVASDGNNTWTSTTFKFWYGSNIILGVSGLYNSTTALTRTDAATGLTWTMTSNEIASDFDNYFPYNMMTKETVDGNAMVYVPEMYWRLGYDSSGRLTDIAVAPEEITTLADGQVSAHSNAFYYGAYGASYDSNNIMQSKSGEARKYSQTRAQFRTAATANGTGYHLIDVYHTRILEMLFLIEFAEKNSESVMWGYTSYGGSCGATDTLTAPSGQLANQGRMRWRYIEDFIGNGYEFFDGIAGMAVTDNPTNYTDDATGKIAFSGTNLTSGYELAALYSPDSNNPLLLAPKECVNNSSYNTYFCDYVYCNSTATYVYCRGRDSSGSNNGLFYWYYFVTSVSYSFIGSRLMKSF